MKKTLEQVCPKSSILPELAKQFEAVGLVKEAISCYVKAGNIDSALETCVKLNNWDDAVTLSEKYENINMDDIVTQEANILLRNGEKLRAVELYRKANCAIKAAQLLSEIARDIIKEDSNFTLAKKFHVLAAFEVQRYRKETLSLTHFSNENEDANHNTESTLNKLMSNEAQNIHDSKSTRVLDSAWRGASACHYFLLSHNQLYAGELDAAMLSAIRCIEYEQILGAENVFSLVALTSFHRKHYGVCSRAFIKLEILSSQSQERLESIQTLVSLERMPRLIMYSSSDLNEAKFYNYPLGLQHIHALSTKRS